MIVREKLSLVLGCTYAAAAANASATSASSRKPEIVDPARSVGAACRPGCTPIVTRSKGRPYWRIAKWNAASSQSQPLPPFAAAREQDERPLEAVPRAKAVGVVARRGCARPRR